MNPPNQYSGLYQQFRWLVPARFSISNACCERWAGNSADARRIALFLDAGAAGREIWTFERLQEATNRLAHALRRMGVRPGDRLAVILPPRGEFLAGLFAAWTIGAICVPLPPGLDPYTLERCLRDSAARVVLVDADSHAKLLPGLHRCTALQQIIGLDVSDERVVPWRGLLARQPAVAPTPPDAAPDIALLFYDTRPGSPPRGLAHAHAALIGALPGFVASHDWFPQHSGSYWVGLEWASAAGLLGGVLPCLYFGRPLVASRGLPAAEAGHRLLRQHGVTHALVSPWVLQQLRRHPEAGRASPPPMLRQLASTGQRLGPGLRHWVQQQWGVTLNDRYGTAEAPIIAGHSASHWPSPPGSLGPPYPGHRMAILDPRGQPLPPGQVGDIAVAYTDIHQDPDPALWRGAWPGLDGQDDAWWRTGDLGHLDAEGRFWLHGQTAHLLPVGGETIDPEILEAAMLEHPEVLDAGVVALGDDPDHQRFKAWIVAPGTDDPLTLQPALEALRQALLPPAAASVPWVIELTDHLPRQPSGRLQRAALRSRDRSRRRRSRKAA
ncbi:MAG: AMP-binding protein [Pigmentiphaga sp.]